MVDVVDTPFRARGRASNPEGSRRKNQDRSDFSASLGLSAKWGGCLRRCRACSHSQSSPHSALPSRAKGAQGWEAPIFDLTERYYRGPIGALSQLGVWEFGRERSPPQSFLRALILLLKERKTARGALLPAGRRRCACFRRAPQGDVPSPGSGQGSPAMKTLAGPGYVFKDGHAGVTRGYVSAISLAFATAAGLNESSSLASRSSSRSASSSSTHGGTTPRT